MFLIVVWSKHPSDILIMFFEEPLALLHPLVELILLTVQTVDSAGTWTLHE